MIIPSSVWLPRCLGLAGEVGEDRDTYSAKFISEKNCINKPRWEGIRGQLTPWDVTRKEPDSFWWSRILLVLVPQGRPCYNQKSLRQWRTLWLMIQITQVSMTLLEDGDLETCRLHFEVELCDHKFSAVIRSKYFRESLAVGDLEWPTF